MFYDYLYNKTDFKMLSGENGILSIYLDEKRFLFLDVKGIEFSSTKQRKAIPNSKWRRTGITEKKEKINV